MHRIAIRSALVAVVFAGASRTPATSPELVPCEDLPASVAALGSKSEIEAFGIAPAVSVAVAAMASPGDGARSVIRFARDGDEPRVVKLAGQVLGLAVAADGGRAYAVVRMTDRKHVVKSVELVTVDLATARSTFGATLPVTARGLAIGSGGATLLVASRDEIRTFQLPGLASGPLYRALGDNVGVAPIAASSFVLVAQPSRIAIADLAAPQGRDGLELSQESAAPAILRGMLASAGEAGPIALGEGESAWCVRVSLPAAPSPPSEAPVESVPVEPPPTEPAPAQPPPAEPAPVDPVPVDPVPVEAPPVVASSREAPAEPGTVFGVVAGASLVEVAALVFLGPDNVLREAARVVPDERGRFSVAALPAGSYRMVAAGKEGRVLICDPPFVMIRVGSNGAVEAPVLKVLRAQ